MPRRDRDMRNPNDEQNRILVIDDNPAIHDDFRKILGGNKPPAELLSAEANFFGEENDHAPSPLNIQIDSAYQGEEGVAMVREASNAGTPYQVAFVDMRMPPGLDGLKTIEEVWRVDPRLEIVICTAFSDKTWNEIRERLNDTNQLLILKKPFDVIEVSQLAVALSEKWNLARLAELHCGTLEQLVDKRSVQLKNAESALKEQNGFLQLATSISEVGYWRWDLQSNKQTWSDDIFRILGADAADTPTLKKYVAHHHVQDQAIVRLKIDETIQEQHPVEFKARVVLPGGEIRHVLTKTVCEVDDNGHTTVLFGVTRDVTRDEIAMQAVQHAALHDPLTDLANRTKFQDRLIQALELTTRHDRSMALALIDLDNFKEINDEYGHPIGDELLRQFSERLRETLRAADTVARLGGDEFAIIQSPLDKPAPIQRLMQRISESMESPFEIQGNRIKVSFSGGIAMAPNDGLDADELLRSADLALYNAKREENGAYQFFEKKMDENFKRRRRIESDLKLALENDELRLHYQPIFDAGTNNVYCLEALIRWQHPKLGLIPPGNFIDIAEETGQIIPIGDWVLFQACRDAATLPEHIRVAVNVSAIQFRDHRLTSTVTQALKESGIAANRLELEITESVILHDGEETMQQLHRLRELGTNIAMDDFGTGYSSLSYLRSFPFDRLKLDRSFVMDATTERDAQAIVRAVASLGISLGIETTAEGVETIEQLERITEEGYTHFQGFLRGKPAPLSEIELMMNKGS